MAEVFVGRQPIFDRQSKVFAYELLYRSADADHAGFLDADQATGDVLVNTFIEIGLQQLVQEHLAFINFTRSLILGKHWRALPNDRVVIEVLEDVVADQEILEALGDLSEEGYRIALDDVCSYEEVRGLVELADYVKIDLPRTNTETLRELVAALRPMHKSLVAEKVELPEEFEYCKQLGCDYFQGFFFCRPTIVRGKRLPENRMALLLLLTKLNDRDVTIDELTAMIEADLTLSYKLARFVNSAGCGLRRKVDSIRDAAVMVGTERVRSWASVLVIASMTEQTPEIMATAIQRATMCERLARAMKCAEPKRFFTVGLFSPLDCILGLPMAEVVKLLPLSSELNDALLHRSGLLGSTLNCVLEYERANWESAQCAGLDASAIVSSYAESVASATKLTQTLGD